MATSLPLKRFTDVVSPFLNLQIEKNVVGGHVGLPGKLPGLAVDFPAESLFRHLMLHNGFAQEDNDSRYLLSNVHLL